MGAEGAKMRKAHPYLSGQWTEQSLCEGVVPIICH